MNLGFFYVLVSTVMFATNAIWVKMAYNMGMTMWQILTLESLIASFLLVGGLAIFMPSTFKVTWSQYKRLFVQGILGFLLNGIFLYGALQHITAALATVLFYTYPVLVTLYCGIVWKKGLPPVKLISVILVFTGAVLAINIFTPGDISVVNWTGVTLALLAAATCAFFIIYGEVVLTNMSALTVTLYCQLSSTVVLLSFNNPFRLFADGITWPMFFLAFLLATTASTLPVLLLLKGINLIGADKASIISTFELPATLVFAYFLLTEPIFGVQVVGSFIILTGILLVRLDRSQKSLVT